MPGCLVVGGGGFIGSHTVRSLIESGREDILVVGRSERPRFPLPAEVRYLRGDAEDAAFLEPILAECDEVLDLAYATVPKTSFDDPVHDVLVNLPATVTLLKLCSRRSLRRLVLVSSGGTVYGNADYLPIDESHPTNPVSPYGITKLASEKYALLFHRLAGLPVVIARPGNAYGPGQSGDPAQGFVGTAMFAAMNRVPVHLFGERGTTRDYVYVEDVASGLLAALEHGRPGEAYNIGTGVGLDNQDVLDILERTSSPEVAKIEVVREPPRPFDVLKNVLSSARLTDISGWRPEVEAPEGFHRTWHWVQAQQETSGPECRRE